MGFASASSVLCSKLWCPFLSQHACFLCYNCSPCAFGWLSSRSLIIEFCCVDFVLFLNSLDPFHELLHLVSNCLKLAILNSFCVVNINCKHFRLFDLNLVSLKSSCICILESPNISMDFFGCLEGSLLGLTRSVMQYGTWSETKKLVYGYKKYFVLPRKPFITVIS